MSCLTYSGQILSRNYLEEIRNIMKILKNYMNNVKGKYLKKIFANEHVSFLQDFWNAIQDLEKDKYPWVVGSILSPQEEFEQLKKCQQQEFVFDFPVWNESIVKFPEINNYFALQLVIPEKKIALIDWCIVCEYLHDILLVFFEQPNLAAQHLINLPLTFDHKFLTMESIFTTMLHLPTPKFSYLYYAQIIINLFEKQPKIWPKAVGRCLLYLFERIEKLDIELRDRLARWFAFHLNAFGNNWPWNKWNFVVNLHFDSPKRRFCEQVLRLQMEIRNWEKIVNTLSKTFIDLMPNPPKPQIKFNLSSIYFVNTKEKTLNQIVGRIIHMLNKKLSVEDVQIYLDTWIDLDLHGQFGRLEVFLTCLLHIGQTSYSHFLSYFKVYKTILSDIITSNKTRCEFLCVLYQYWKKSQNRFVVLLQKFLQYKIINPTSIVNFVFLSENCVKHSDTFWMHVLIIALDRVFLTYFGLNEKLNLVHLQLNKLKYNDKVFLNLKVVQMKNALKQLTPIVTDIGINCIYQGFFNHFNLLIKKNKTKKENFIWQIEIGNMIWITRKYRKGLAIFKSELRKKFFDSNSNKGLTKVFNLIFN